MAFRAKGAKADKKVFMTDPIADMLTRIRNAQLVKKSEVVLPYSKIKFNIAQILSQEKWLGKVEKIEPEFVTKMKNMVSKDKEAKFSHLKIELLYGEGRPKITQIKRISKPGRRVYAKKDKLPVVLNNYGLAIISTPQGLMTNKAAKKAGVGGEVVCEVY